MQKLYKGTYYSLNKEIFRQLNSPSFPFPLMEKIFSLNGRKNIPSFLELRRLSLTFAEWNTDK